VPIYYESRISKHSLNAADLPKLDDGKAMIVCMSRRIPFAKAVARASPGAHFLRAKGPAPYQPRATPWEPRRKDHPSLEGATQPPRLNMARPFRAQSEKC
jgi:hypothetical protein